jgi:AcrR family transcriptional regulator
MTSSSPRPTGPQQGEIPAAAHAEPANSRRTGSAQGTVRRELVENEMLEQATRLFAERGFAGTSLQDVADAVGITRPALYYYVKSKDDLLAKLVTEVTEAPAADLGELASRADLDPAEKLRAVARLIVLRRAAQPERFRLLIRSEASLPPDLARAYDASRKAVLRTVSEVIEQGVVGGQFRPVDSSVAALAVLGMCNWVAWWFHPGGRHGADAVANQLADMALAAVQRADSQALREAGPAAAIAKLRQDLDHLERIIVT